MRGVQHLQHGQINIAGDADAGLACIDGARGAARSILLGRVPAIGLRVAIPAPLAGAAGDSVILPNLSVLRSGVVKVSDVFETAGIDVAPGGPGENIAAAGGHDTALPNHHAAQRIDVDIAVLPLGDQAGIGAGCDASITGTLPPFTLAVTVTLLNIVNWPE